MISKAFELCGIVHPQKFDIQKLHEPLRRCFDENFDDIKWMSQFGSLVTDENYSWEFPTNKAFSLFHVIFQYVETTSKFPEWSSHFVTEVTKMIKADEMLSEVWDDEDEHRFVNGMPTESFAEFHAISRLLNVKITLCELDENFSTTQETSFGEQQEDILIALCDEKFGSNVEIY
jgi:hypothetical protein